jgi:hypothetical protein
MYLFLARSIRELQWHALLLQACGLAVTQAGNTNLNYSPSVYALLVLMTCIGSVAGVLNDHYCKSTKASLNAQNMLLYVVGVVLNFTIFLAKRAQNSDEPGFWEGYGSIGAVSLIFLNASIGLIITMVYKCKRGFFVYEETAHPETRCRRYCERDGHFDYNSYSSRGLGSLLQRASHDNSRSWLRLCFPFVVHLHSSGFETSDAWSSKSNPSLPCWQAVFDTLLIGDAKSLARHIDARRSLWCYRPSLPQLRHAVT